MLKRIHISTPSVRSVVGAVALLTALLSAPALAQEAVPVWEPGTPYPREGLKEFPCHDYALPCGEMGSPPIERVSYTGPRDGDAEKGERIALNVRWGNCLACHSVPKGHEGGTIGPDLSNYGTRGLPFDYTFQRIWDGRLYSPDAHMPVYGPNKVLTIQDILDVIAFIESGS